MARLAPASRQRHVPSRAHERQRVAVLHHSRAHAVIEDEAAIFKPVFEMDVRRGDAEPARQLGQRKVVGGDESDGAEPHEGGDDRIGADPAVVRVGACQDLVKQEERRHLSARQIDDGAYPDDLRIEARLPGLQ